MEGILLKALASLKSYRPKDEGEPSTSGGERNPTVDFGGRESPLGSNEFKTEPDALLFRKSKGATPKLNCMDSF